VVFGLNQREKVSLVFRLRGDITLTDAERRRDGAEKSAARYQLPGIVDHVDQGRLDAIASRWLALTQRRRETGLSHVTYDCTH
jgi:hypothetical protein